MTITFDAEKHEYRDCGVRLPSVTQVISAAGLYGNTSFFTDYSRDRGSFVHQIIEWHLSKELDESTIDPVLMPYFEAWKRFERESSYVSDSCETRLASATYRFAGTIDHIGHLGGHFCIIDVKTGALNPAGALQLAGYELLLKTRGARRFTLQLKDDGNYKLTEHKDRQDKDIFLAALACYYWKQNNNVKG
jgi:hypothetical protein